MRPRGGRANDLHRVEVGGHDDLVEGSRQLGGQLGFSLLALRCGEVVQSRPGKEVIDHAHTVVLACNENGNGVNFTSTKDFDYFICNYSQQIQITL